MSERGQEKFHVAIVGAGIAGLGLAIGLYKQGVPFTLYEEAPQFSTVGAGIGFGPNGLLAMDLLEENFRPKYEAICVGNAKPKDQNVFFEGLLCKEGLGFDESWYGQNCWGSPSYTRKSAHRREVLDILTSFIPIDQVKFGKRLVDIREDDDNVILHFADGESVRASAVVGADGIESVIRKYVLQPLYPDEVEPVYAHSYVYRAVIPMEEAKEILSDLTDTAKIYVGEGYNLVTYRVSGGKASLPAMSTEAEFNFLHGVCRPNDPWGSPGSVTEKVTEKEMIADFEGRGMDERLLQLLKKANPIRWGLFHHPRTSTYFSGRVALLGDSAHASMPYQAAGAGQGIEDALILSTVLGKIAPSAMVTVKEQLQAAYESYDAIRRPRAQKQTEQSLDAGVLLTFQDPQAGSDMNKVLQRMQGRRFDWLWFHDLRQDVNIARKRMDQALQDT